MKSPVKILASSLFLLLPFLLLTGVDRENSGVDPAMIRAAPDSMRVLPHTVIIKLREGVAFRTSGASTAVPDVDACLQPLGPYRVSPLHPSNGLSKSLSAAGREVDRILIVSYEAERDPRAVAADLSRNGSVAYAQPSYVYPFHHTPNDPLLAQQSIINLFKLTQAWDVTTGDSTVAIGDVDSGCDWTHPDLNPNIYINKGEWGVAGELSNNGVDDDNDGKIDDWHGWDFVGNGTDASPLPDNNPMDGTLGHGTMTSGCASAATNNGMGVAGVGYRTKILPVKAASNTGTGISYGYQGIMYAADMGCRVINTSWGGSGPFDQAMQDAIDYAYAKGALIVASSGNVAVDNDDSPFYPSSLNHVLNVGATETSGQVANWCVYGTSVGVYALGSNILTTAAGGGYSSPGQIQGTSFSAPYTSGVAALLFGMHPNWNPDQVAEQIHVSSDAINTPRAPKMYGRVNAFKAVSTNQNLADIPGVRLASFAASIPGGTMLTRPGQTAQVTMILENVLAPTSAAAAGTVEFDDANLSCAAPDVPLGAMNTFQKKTVTFPVTLSQNPSVSEGWLPVRLKITDGTYVDYVVGRVPVYLNNNWHLSAVFGAPSITSIHALDGNVVWAVAHVTSPLQDYCIRTTNGGATWSNATPANYFGGAGLYCVAAISATTALAGTGPTGGAAEVYRTANGGLSWSKSSVSSITGFVDAIHMFDAQNGILVGDPVNGKWGIAKTTDGGASWSAVTPQLSAAGTEAGWNNSLDFVGDIGWFGTNKSKVYKTTDRGATWTPASLPDQHAVNVSFRDESVGLVKFSAVTNQGGREALAVTTDGGATWRSVTTLAMVSGSEALMERNGSRMWVIQGGNSYMSSDLGQTWSLNAVPSSFTSASCLAQYRGGDFTDLYAGGLYVFKMHIDAQSLSAGTLPSPRGYGLAQNYPNPVGGNGAGGRWNTTIPFMLAAQERVRITLCDQLGREVMTLVDAELAPGAHTASFGTAGLPAGTYHYIMRAGGEVRQRSMIILR